MKRLAIFSKKSIIIISAIFFICGALILGIPVICSAGAGPGGPGGWGAWGSGTGYVHVPIINNIGETLTIRRMYIDTPPGDDDLRVRAISFVGEVNDSYTAAGANGYSQKRSGQTSEANRIISFDNFYRFSNAEAECIITFDVDLADIPSGIYTIRYYFQYDNEDDDRTNTVTFTLP